MVEVSCEHSTFLVLAIDFRKAVIFRPAYHLESLHQESSHDFSHYCQTNCVKASNVGLGIMLF